MTPIEELNSIWMASLKRNSPGFNILSLTRKGQYLNTMVVGGTSITDFLKLAFKYGVGNCNY